MKLKTTIIVLLVAACGAWAQSPTAPAKTPEVKVAAPAKKAPKAAGTAKKARKTKSAAKAPAAKPAAPEAKPAAANPAAKKASEAKPATKAPAAKPAVTKSTSQAKPAAPANKSAAAKPVVSAKKAPQAKSAATRLKSPMAAAKTPATKAAKPASTKKGRRKSAPAQAKTKITKTAPAKAPQPEEPAAPVTASAKPIRREGQRDPFLSPIVTTTASAPRCQLGKGCLSIGEIVIKGTAKSEDGMLAVVENSAKKVYFLRENDPVFNGYVAKITMDGVVFRENVVDNLGHTSTREVVKKIPATVPGQA